jgi:5-methylthioadenosine/S-adenosylhomocysteine deaminase
MSRTLIRDGTLLVPDENSRLRGEPGNLLIEGERIIAVGEVGLDNQRGRVGSPGVESNDVLPADAGPLTVVDASDCIVLPGLIQSHVHLCQTLFRGAADDLPLLDWLRRRIWPLEAAHDPDSMRASARLAIAELLRGGTTAVQTMETVRHTEVALEALAESGMFAVAGKCLMDDPATSPPDLVEPTDVALQEAVDLAETWHGAANGRLKYCLAPRFAVSCTDSCLRQVGELATELGLRIHTHASENREEETLVERRSGQRNVAYLDTVGCTGSHVGIAHCIWVNDAEIELLAGTGTHVLHCPGSNCKLGSGVAPVPRLLDAGVAVSLGADGAPCNNALDIFREMRLTALIHKAGGDPEAVPAGTALDLATRGGARALGWEGDMGALVPGAWANVVIVDLRRLHTTPRHDPVSTLVYSTRAADIRDVWLAGRQVVEEGRLTLWDEDEVRAEADEEALQLHRRAGLA